MYTTSSPGIRASAMHRYDGERAMFFILDGESRGERIMKYDHQEFVLTPIPLPAMSCRCGMHSRFWTLRIWPIRSSLPTCECKAQEGLVEVEPCSRMECVSRHDELTGRLVYVMASTLISHPAISQTILRIPACAAPHCVRHCRMEIYTQRAVPKDLAASPDGWNSEYSKAQDCYIINHYSHHM